MTINGERGRGPRWRHGGPTAVHRPLSPCPVPGPGHWSREARGCPLPTEEMGGGPILGAAPAASSTKRALGPREGTQPLLAGTQRGCGGQHGRPGALRGREPGEGPRAPDPEGPGSKDKGLLGWLVLFRRGEAAWARAAWLGILGPVPALSAPRERKREAVVGEPRWSRGLASCVPRLGISPSPTEETVLWCLGPRSLERFAGHLPEGMCQAVNVLRLSCCRGRGCRASVPSHGGHFIYGGVGTVRR